MLYYDRLSGRAPQEIPETQPVVLSPLALLLRAIPLQHGEALVKCPQLLRQLGDGCLVLRASGLQVFVQLRHPRRITRSERGRSMRWSCSQRVLASECRRRFSRPGYRSAGRRSRLAMRTIRSQASNSTASSFRPLPATRSGTRVPPQIARAFWATRPPNEPEVATGGGSSPQSSVPGDHPTASSNARAW